MKNEITRKITSLTLLTILLASGVTFAAPGVMPVAEAAHNANLFVSAESSLFKNTFGGPMVIEIVINDPALTDTDEAKGEPDVTINGKDVRMVQGSDGLWYAYVADRTQAQLADQLTVGTPGVGLDFGTFCAPTLATTLDTGGFGPLATFTDTVGIAISGLPTGALGSQGTAEIPLVTACDTVVAATPGVDSDVNVVREEKALATGSINGPGQLDITAAAWPFIQLYDFNPTGNVEVKYNKGGGTQTTTLTFDTMDTYSKITLDRTSYTTGSEVQVVLTDGALNIDPTDEDSWTFGTNPAATATHYQVFNENGATSVVPDSTASPDITGTLPALMFEDNGIVKLNGNTQGGASVVDLDANNDQQASPPAATGFVDGTIATSTITGGTILLAGSQPVTFVEGGANTGILTNYDENDDANIDVLPTALRGTSGSIDYNKKATSILVGFGFGTIAFATPSGEWSSGEEIAVTLVDPDANKNSRADEDLDVNNPITALIPALAIGDPLTLGETGDGATIIASFIDSVAPASIATTENVEAFSKRATLTAAAPLTATIDNLAIDLQTDVADLYNTVRAPVNPPVGIATGVFNGFNFLNIDLRSITADPVTVSLITVPNGCPIIGAAGLANGDDDGDGLIDEDPVNLLDDDGDVAIDEDPATCSPTSVTVIAAGVNEQSLTNISAAPIYLLTTTDEIGLNIAFTTPVTTVVAETDPIVSDFFSFGIVSDGLKTLDRVNNSIYRFELEESGDNTSTFIGTAEFTMLNQLNILDAATYANLRTIDDEVTFIVHEDLTDEDAPRISYLDLGQDGTSVQISAQQDAATHSGVVAFDKDAFKVGDTVTITLTDGDLNVDSDLIDIFVTVPPTGDPADDTIGRTGLATYVDGTSFGRLLDVTFDDERWLESTIDTTVPPNGADCANIDGANPALDDGLSDAGFTLHETGTDTGVFIGDFAIPGTYCSRNDGQISSTTGLDLEVNYVDFRDASGEVIEVGDGAGIRANTGSVSFDRTVYPVPFGDTANFAAAAAATGPNGRAIFPVHVTGIVAPIGAGETLGDGTVSTHIRVNDPDFDVSASGEDKIQQDRADQPTGPVKITISRGANEVTLAYAGGPVAQLGTIDVGDNNALGAGVRELGPITEIAPNAGIFELDFDVRYTDGPADTKCPATLVFAATDGSAFTGVLNRFDIAPAAGNYCILQGDILTVQYTDPTDSSGDPNSITDSATFDLRNGVLQSDKSVYIIGSDMIMTLIEPDLDLDSDSAESWDLDLIEWDSDAETTTMGNLGGTANQAAFDPEPSDFRETGDNTGIFQIVIEIPNTLSGERLDRGEEIQLEYTDWGPSGADFVGDEDEDVNLTIYTSNFGATVELDQKVYTWTDKVFITIVAPDHNFDSNLVDDIGNTQIDQITVATRGEKLKQYKLVETGTDTGIFTGEVILTGFPAQDADGDGNIADATGNQSVCPPCGPTDGFLPADDDDGMTVSFEFTEDETVVGSALVRWNIGEVQFLEASYPATGQGVVRVVDPDMNLNPEAVDNFEVDSWSDSDAGGIDLTVTETNEATGIFEGIIHFTVTDESSGHRLRVAEGDTVTAEYEDNTLPSPYTTADELEIAATTFIGSIVPPLERAPASNPRIVDAFGSELDEVSVDQQVQITADLANGQDRDQSFAYLVQIQDEDGVTTSLSWITGSLAPGQNLNPAQSWTPTSPGTYNVQIFVWESVDNPDALSPPVSTTVDVV